MRTLAHENISYDDRRREAIVRSALRDAADADGWVRFDRFMDIALYTPWAGLYTHDSAATGIHGAFYTAAHVSPLFGETIGAHLRSIVDRIPGDAPKRIVELGAGDGALASDLLRGFGPRPGVEYVAIERSASRESRLDERLRDAGAAAGIPTRRATSLAEEGPFDGAIVGNEFLDALPTRRAVRREGAWSEIGVNVADSELRWAERPLVDVPRGRGLPTEAEEGNVLEFSLAAESSLREAADHLRRGVVLHFDYGMEETELLRAHPGGTMEAIRQHRPEQNLLAHPGLSDLSAFVNLTRIRSAAQRAGLTEIACRPQREALADWGIGARLEGALALTNSAEETVRQQLAVKNLLFGFDRFVALELASGEPRTPTSSPEATPT
jgi:SAM-dependent MidA family methyltransferase